MLKWPLTLASPGGPGARLSILIFHRVLPAPDPLVPDIPHAAEFETKMRWLRSWFNILPLDQAVDRLYAGGLPPRALAITFDDGYADNEEVAAPILERLGLSATFFVATGFLDGGCMWNDRVIEAVRQCRVDNIDLGELGLGRVEMGSLPQRRDAIPLLLKAIKHLEPRLRLEAVDAIAKACEVKAPPALMMTRQQLISLRHRGMTIGGHTVTHPILTRLDAVAAREEIQRGKLDIETTLDEPIQLFAYPNGVPGQDYLGGHAQIVEACGFRAAVSTAWGAASARSDRFQLPRFTPWDHDRVRFGVRMLTNFRRRESVAS